MGRLEGSSDFEDLAARALYALYAVLGPSACVQGPQLDQQAHRHVYKAIASVTASALAA